MNRQFVKQCYEVFSKYNMQYLLDTGTSADRTLGDLRDFCLLRDPAGRVTSTTLLAIADTGRESWLQKYQNTLTEIQKYNKQKYRNT